MTMQWTDARRLATIGAIALASSPCVAAGTSLRMSQAAYRCDVMECLNSSMRMVLPPVLSTAIS